MKKLFLLTALFLTSTALFSMEPEAKKPKTTPVTQNDIKACYKACRSGHTETASALLDKGVDVNTRLYSPVVPIGCEDSAFLHWATAGGHTATVEFLLEREADASVADDYKKTPLHLAVERQHVPVVEALLNAGAHVDATEDGNIPLHHIYSIFIHQKKPDIEKSIKISSLLHAKGAQFWRLNKRFASPLHYAASANSPELILSLLGVHRTEESKQEARDRLRTFLLVLNRPQYKVPRGVRNLLISFLPVDFYHAETQPDQHNDIRFMKRVIKNTLSPEEFGAFEVTLDTKTLCDKKRPCDLATDKTTKALLDPETWR